MENKEMKSLIGKKVVLVGYGGMELRGVLEFADNDGSRDMHGRERRVYLRMGEDVLFGIRYEDVKEVREE